MVVRTLSKLTPTALAVRARHRCPARALRLARACSGGADAGQARPAALVEHVPALLVKLNDSEEHVRNALVETLSKLGSAALVAHVPALGRACTLFPQGTT